MRMPANEYLKGRGAQINPANRFHDLQHDPDPTEVLKTNLIDEIIRLSLHLSHAQGGHAQT